MRSSMQVTGKPAKSEGAGKAATCPRLPDFRGRYIVQRMVLIARNSGRRKSCWNYNLRCIPKTFGFAPTGTFPSTLQHCRMSFPT